MVVRPLSPDIIEEVVAEVVGSDVLPLVRVLKNKKNVSEFKLAESIKKEINTTRNMLYRLYDVNLVSFVRKKDKIKGWYIYYWTFNPEHIKYLLTSIKQKRLEVLKERLERERKGLFFSCPNACVRLDFDQAASFKFKCPECGQIVNQEDNAAKIAALEREIVKLEQEIKEGVKIPLLKPKIAAREVKAKGIIAKKPKKRRIKKSELKGKKKVRIKTAKSISAKSSKVKKHKKKAKK